MNFGCKNLRFYWIHLEVGLGYLRWGVYLRPKGSHDCLSFVLCVFPS